MLGSIARRSWRRRWLIRCFPAHALLSRARSLSRTILRCRSTRRLSDTQHSSVRTARCGAAAVRTHRSRLSRASEAAKVVCNLTTVCTSAAQSSTICALQFSAQVRTPAPCLLSQVCFPTSAHRSSLGSVALRYWYSRAVGPLWAALACAPVRDEPCRANKPCRFLMLGRSCTWYACPR